MGTLTIKEMLERGETPPHPSPPTVDELPPTPGLPDRNPLPDWAADFDDELDAPVEEGVGRYTTSNWWITHPTTDDGRGLPAELPTEPEREPWADEPETPSSSELANLPHEEYIRCEWVLHHASQDARRDLLSSVHPAPNLSRELPEGFSEELLTLPAADHIQAHPVFQELEEQHRQREQRQREQRERRGRNPIALMAEAAYASEDSDPPSRDGPQEARASQVRERSYAE